MLEVPRGLLVAGARRIFLASGQNARKLKLWLDSAADTGYKAALPAVLG